MKKLLLSFIFALGLLMPAVSSAQTPSITILTPNGGETISLGRKDVNLLPFTWSATHVPKQPVAFLYSPMNASVVSKIPLFTNVKKKQIDSLAVPATVAPGKYKVAVCDNGTIDPVSSKPLCDYSNDYFNLAQTSGLSYKPYIASTEAYAAQSFEAYASGDLVINGKYLGINSIDAISASIGGMQAKAKWATDTQLMITVPFSLTPGNTYPLYITNENGQSNIVTVKIIPIPDPIIDFADSSAESRPIGDSGEVHGVYSIEFEVTAPVVDVYIGRNSTFTAMSTSTGLGLTFTAKKPDGIVPGYISVVSASLESSSLEEPVNLYKIAAGTTRSFNFNGVMKLNGAFTESIRAELTSLNFSTTTTLGYQYLPLPIGEFATNYQMIRGINQPVPQPSYPTVTLSASPNLITAGNYTALKYSSSNATACKNTANATNATTAVQFFYPKQTTTYSVTCFNSYGSASSSVTVVVQPGGTTTRPDLISQALRLSSGSLVKGQSVNFTAEVKNDSIYAQAPSGYIDTFYYRYASGTPWTTVNNTGMHGTTAESGRFMDISGQIYLSESGVLEVMHCVDTTNVTLESNEVNNCNTIFMIVTPGQVLGTYKYNFTKTLQFGDSGTEVTELQKVLTQKGFFSGEPTGFFGEATKLAALHFQGAFQLPAVGIIGAQTRALLNR